MILKSKKLLPLLIVLCMLTTFVPASIAYAEEPEASGPVVNITIDGKSYENINDKTEFIIGNKDINDCDIRIVSVNGHELKNVGTKSGVLDSQGRTVLEFAAVPTGKGTWFVRICYHAGDDPVSENQPYGFEMTNLKFQKTKDSVPDEPTLPKVGKVKSLKAASQSKSLKVSWKKTAGQGYILQYSAKSNFKNAKSVTVKKNSYTIKSLKKNTKYYVRVRAYKTYKDMLGNTKTVNGAWTKVSAKTK